VISQLLPLGPTTTKLRSLYLFHPQSIEAPGFDPTDVVAFSNLVTAQDNAVCERVQKGAVSRSFADGGIYPEKDELVWEFNELYRSERERA
jgi:phenylpropionate dioxygenase-like ring-hydroxylating dioxygenase large terminal subunit